MLRKLLQCPKQLPTVQIIQFKMSIMLRLRNHSLEHMTEELMIKKNTPVFKGKIPSIQRPQSRIFSPWNDVNTGLDGQRKTTNGVRKAPFSHATPASALRPRPQTLLVMAVWVKGLIGDFVALNPL